MNANRYEAFDLETHLLENTRKVGIWCNNCNLPSAATVTVATVSIRSLKVLSRSQLIVCLDCHQHRYEHEDP